MRIEVCIPGEPVAQGRGRAFGFQRGDGTIGARVFDPAKSRNWKAAAQAHMAAEMEATAMAPLSGPLAVEITARFSCPRSQWLKTRPRPERWKDTRPDLDNVVKAVKDAAKGVLWVDDSQVCVLTARKVIGAQGAPPSVRISVLTLFPEGESECQEVVHG